MLIRDTFTSDTFSVQRDTFVHILIALILYLSTGHQLDTAFKQIDRQFTEVTERLDAIAPSAEYTVYTEPSRNSEEIAGLPSRGSFKVIATHGDHWYQVLFDDESGVEKSGWIYSHVDPLPQH